ncbi:helix-turn-helix transcriptional regulator [Thioalkalivibrio paradoxus]|uniref:DNA-binding protein n=1 Tax=Thioalkalivibrio paradoxus ARh 1 TaxID=713585 RepID=W0DFX0_9GAMM|nr:helix-turn-helix transcriptional regulator [Thioalkalivibrio paradoxus]AHE97246.1 DNA-binding protein [Thioalkalivibrio paradoxus ARh 1]
MNMQSCPEMMTTAEVAAYLRLGERKVYDLVREGVIPCVRITGKLLFPRKAIDLWLMNHLESDAPLGADTPAVLAGSHDPLLEWAVRESGSGLALLLNGSGDGIHRLIANEAQAIGFHLVHEDGSWNDPARCGLGGLRDLVTIEWARRNQGLIVASGNPLGITDIPSLARAEVRVVRRPEGTGADVLLRDLLRQAGLEVTDLRVLAHRALTHDDLALEVRGGNADCGVGVEAAARRHGLDFIPLCQERFDLGMRRRAYFQPSLQALFRFARTERFQRQAAALGGYDLSNHGEVRYNA